MRASPQSASVTVIACGSAQCLDTVDAQLVLLDGMEEGKRGSYGKNGDETMHVKSLVHFL